MLIALSASGSDEVVSEMLEAGASGYLLKGGDEKEILNAIEKVAANDIYYCSSVFNKLIKGRVKTGGKPGE